MKKGFVVNKISFVLCFLVGVYCVTISDNLFPPHYSEDDGSKMVPISTIPLVPSTTSGDGKFPPPGLKNTLKVDVSSDSIIHSTQTGKSDLYPERFVTIQFCITNQTNQECAFQVMSCSYEDLWQTDANLISVQGRECDKNIYVTKTLLPQIPYQGTFNLRLSPEIKSGRYLVKLGFTPNKLTKLGSLQETYWSNPIEVNVKE